MRSGRTVCMAVLAYGAAASVALADCPYDHLLVGQDEGTLFLDTSLLYRHWNTDWATNPNPYGQEYYEFTEMWGGGYIRVEPGFGQNTDPTYALEGTRGTDYDILVERVFATPDLLFFDDLMAPILTADGATFTLSDYANHHVHMRYHLPDGLDPALPYTVSYRLKDAVGTYSDSEVYTFNLGAAQLPGDANGDGSVTDADYTIWADNYGASGATFAMGDFSNDGQVSDADYTIWADNYGATAGAVPEPAMLSLLAMGAPALVARRRRIVRSC